VRERDEIILVLREQVARLAHQQVAELARQRDEFKEGLQRRGAIATQSNPGRRSGPLTLGYA
jgi:hypothetical protein